MNTYRIIPTLKLFLLVVILAASQLQAQRLPIDDSVGVFAGVNSRLLWRSVTLADGAGLETGVALPLRAIARGLQLELRGWTALENRDRFRRGDQYAASAHYQIPLHASPASTSLVLAYNEYWTPNSLPLPHHSEEFGAKLFHDFRLPLAGVRTIRTELEAAKDIGRRKTNWLRGSAAVSAGTTIIKVNPRTGNETRHTIIATLTAAISASDLGASPAAQAGPDFGFDSGELELDVEHRLNNATGSLALSSTLRVGLVSRATRLGPDVGWFGLRESILFF